MSSSKPVYKWHTRHREWKCVRHDCEKCNSEFEIVSRRMLYDEEGLATIKVFWCDRCFYRYLGGRFYDMCVRMKKEGKLSRWQILDDNGDLIKKEGSYEA